MQLNSYILVNHLQGVTYKKLCSDPLTGTLSTVNVYDPGGPLKPDTIYILENYDIQKFPPVEHPYVIVSRGVVPPFLLEDSRCDILCFASSYTVSEIFIELQRVLRLFHQWEQDMLEVLMKHQSLDMLCRAAIPIFGNTVLLLGPNHEILGVGEEPGVYEITYEYREQDTDFLSAELILDLSSDPNYYNTFHYDSPQYYVDMEGATCLYMNIYLEGRYMARIVIDCLYKDLNEGDWLPLCILGDYVRKELELYSITSFNNLEAFKSQLYGYLTTNTFSNGHMLEYTLERIGWEKGDRYSCILLKPGRHTVLSKGIHHLANIVENSLQNCIALEVEEEILVICNKKTLLFSQEELKKKVTYLVREHIMKAGFSTEFDDFLSLSAFYLQAKAALEMGEAVQSTLWIYNFSDYALPYILRHGLYALPPKALIPMNLQKMLEYDKLHESAYYTTFRIYLEQNMSATRVTELLYIHRSTFKYRLKRIEEFMEGEDFNDPVTKLYYLNIFALIEAKDHSS